MIPNKHRLGLIRAAVARSSWLEVDPWEITRRRVMDYLSVLKHTQELFEHQFPDFPIKVHYIVLCLCGTRLGVQ